MAPHSPNPSLSLTSFSISFAPITRLLATALFFLLTTRAGAETGVHWTPITALPPWAPGLNQVATVVFQNQLWVARWDSVSSPHAYKLWNTADGIHWQTICDKLPTTEPMSMVVFQNELWLVQPQMNSTEKHLFHSPDGKAWTTVSAVAWKNGIQADWPPPATRFPIAFAGKLWVFGTDDHGNSSDWETRDGQTWYAATYRLPSVINYNYYNYAFAHAYLFQNVLYHRAGSYKNNSSGWSTDTWASDNMTTWTQVPECPSPNRYALTNQFEEYDGRLWMIGSLEARDVWSTIDVRTWTQATANAPWSQGANLQTAVFAGKLWVIDILNGYLWYTWLPGGAPIIDPLPNQVMTEGSPYTSPTPLLTQGTKPVTWSLVSSPAGMTINPATGVTSWPFPPDTVAPYRIRLQAKNSIGTAQTSWTLTVKSFSPPSLATPLIVQGTQTTATWSVVPNINGYTIQRAATRDFAAPLETTVVSSTTLHHVSIGLTGDKVYWYRVHGNKVIGLPGAWSNITSCTQDATPPVCTLAQDPEPLGSWPSVYLARLTLSASDPGLHPSGLAEMRFSTDQHTWTPWRPFAPHMDYWLGAAGELQVYAQLRDRVGNLTQGSATVTANPCPAVMVDCNNTTGPWQGTIEHPYQKIQDAFDAAGGGSTILVAPGVYRENLRFYRKDVVLRSAAPESQVIVKATIIDGGMKATVITFSGTETPAFQVAGFTICHGYAFNASSWAGGGIRGNYTHATICNNRIVNNRSCYITSTSGGSYEDGWSESWYYIAGAGGGLAHCNGLIENNLIACNAAATFISTPDLSNSLPGDSAPAKSTGKPAHEAGISHTSGSGNGSALFDCNGVIQNNTIWGNITCPDENSWDGWGNTWMTHAGLPIAVCGAVIRNNIVAGNMLDGLSVSSSAPLHCCIPGWSGPGTANITADPRLADPAHGDFHLLPDSPCIDAGVFVPGLLRDIDGESRGFDTATTPRGDGSHFDIGADEYHPAAPAVQVLEPHGGESLKAQDVFRIQVALDPARAGGRVRLELRDGQGKTMKAWSFPAPGGNLLIFQHLPDVDGADFRFRALSESDTTLFDQSPPFEIHRVLGNAVAPWAWRRYQ